MQFMGGVLIYGRSTLMYMVFTDLHYESTSSEHFHL
jgi:hypothetical protein